jgi:hypothetical protein
MFNRYCRYLDTLQTISKYPLIRIILSLVSIGLIATAIGMELLPEEEAKVFVIPTLVAALAAGIGMLSISKMH